MSFDGNLAHILAAIFTFIIIVIASNSIAKGFQKFKLPLITGFIIIGVIAGPDVLKMIQRDSLDYLKFIDKTALAFIAFAAGNEMFLKELKGRLRQIGIMTASQFIITFFISFFILLFISDYIPFLAHQPKAFKIGFSLLIATIFIARSPASAIAVINELKAKGPFTQISLGVTILKDILVILLFSITLSISDNLIRGFDFNYLKILLVFFEITVSITLGFIYCQIIKFLFSLKISSILEIIIFLFIGWSMFGFSNFVEHFAKEYFNINFHIEALLTGLVASFRLTNNTKYRLHLESLVHKIGPFVYVAFFTKVGADLELKVLFNYWQVAFILFFIRLTALIIASFTGSFLIRDNFKRTIISWTPYVTQAGVTLGLITIISSHFSDLKIEFETILIAVVIINELIGPPLLKWALILTGEAHQKTKFKFDGIRDVIIFGLENQSINLAHSLQKQNWNVKIVTCEKYYLESDFDKENLKSIEIINLKNLSIDCLQKLNMESADAVVLLMSDYNNYKVAEMIYENFSTPTIVVRLESFKEIAKFKKFNARVVEPRTAMTSLLEHFVRSPYATSLLFGTEDNKEIADIEILNRDIHGKAIREIHLPLGILLLSVRRGGENIITHGYTRLRLHDIVTVLGKPEDIEQTRFKLQF